ncbi:hypothetical protein METP2_03720 [Methanosarcinales archaeon]|nr:restriction endonuclease subunit S [Candidatus Methanoperedens sp.]CAG1006068.1 hypothetical protein METP2_03720 [Methanosarcinales archaeon]
MKQELKETETEDISDDWQVVKVKDVARINELSIYKNYQYDLIEYIDISSIENRQILNTQKLSISEAPSRAKRIVRDNDILISTVRPNLKHFTFIKKAKENTVASTGFAVITSYKANPQYLYYYLTTDQFTNFLTQIADTHTSTYPAFNPDVIENADILLPSEDEQNKIANTLGALDEKIALNRSMNSTLEAIGQALFRLWFADFEFPDEEGKPYRSSGGEMVETELGEVPKGWRVGTLGDICEITMGQSPPGETYNEIGDGLPFYQGISDFGFRFPSRRVYCTVPTRFAEEGDVLLSVRAPVGTFNIADERCAIGRGVAALRLKGKHSGYLYYLLHTTQTGWNKFEAEGTVFGSVTKSDVHDFKVILPPETLRNWFGSLVETLDKQITINEKQSRTLAAIRDALLPKLMSGEIRVNTIKHISMSNVV